MLDELHARMADNTHGIAEALLRRTQRGYFELLRRHSPLKGLFLEIGPDRGLLAEMCLREGGFERFVLFEPNRAVEAGLRARLAGGPCEIVSSMLDASRLPDAGVAAAAVVHVLDHLLEPARVLRQLRAKLAGGSALLLVTHDESSLLARWAGRRWPAFCLAHPQLFNPETLGCLLAACGYRSLETIRTVNYYPLPHLAQHLASALGLASLSLDRWSGPALPLRLGNMAAVASPATG